GERAEERVEEEDHADRTGRRTDFRIAMREARHDLEIEPRDPKQAEVRDQDEDAAFGRGPEIGIVRGTEEVVLIDLARHLAEVPEPDPEQRIVAEDLPRAL